MSKMVYLPYVHFEQGKGEPKGNGWYFTQYNAETGEGKGWHGIEFMPDCLMKRNVRAANRKQSSLM